MSIKEAIVIKSDVIDLSLCQLGRKWAIKTMDYPFKQVNQHETARAKTYCSVEMSKIWYYLSYYKNCDSKYSLRLHTFDCLLDHECMVDFNVKLVMTHENVFKYAVYVVFVIHYFLLFRLMWFIFTSYMGCNDTHFTSFKLVLRNLSDYQKAQNWAIFR